MRELTPIELHIEKLNEMTNDIAVSYSLGFKEKGIPTVGIRKYSEERDSDCVNCDGIVYLVAGDAYDTEGNHLERVIDIHDTPIDNIRVHLRAQASIMGRITTVYLGTRTVWEKKILSDERGILHLNKEQ